MHKWSVRLVALVLSLGLAACGEQLESGAACPALCSGQSLALRDTVVDGVVIDTTLSGFPPRGSSNLLMLANSGDTLDVRYIVRFDSLITTYATGTTPIDITEIDSAHVRLTIEEELSRFTAPVVFEAYDVDSDAVDSVTTALLPLFTPDRLLGTLTVDSAVLQDSVRIFLNDAVVLAKIQEKNRLRIGIRVRSVAPVRIAVLTANTASFPILRYHPALADTTAGFITVLPRSGTPAGEPRIALDFTDYALVAAGQPPLPPDVIGVGGARGRRIYIRFNLPASIIDSTTIVRATLILTQRPAPTYGFSDSVTIGPQVVIATREITDLSKAALITDTLPGRSPPSIFGLPFVRIPPASSAERSFDIANVARFWRSTTAEQVPQAIVLRSTSEGIWPAEVQFYSMEAARALRPRLQITYLPRSEFGIP